MVETLSAYAADEPFNDRIRQGARYGIRNISIRVASQVVFLRHLADQLNRLAGDPFWLSFCLTLEFPEQLHSVSGLTIRSACFQWRSRLAQNSSPNRSPFVSWGRLTWRCRMLS
jgi:hypothetical protein